MTPTIPKRIAICYHPEASQETEKLVQEICNHLESRKDTCCLRAALTDEDLRQQAQSGNFDLLIAIGGDGTMLRAGQLSASGNVPILGINTGSFGFLTEVQAGHWEQALQQLWAGSYRIEERMTLLVELWRAEKKLGSWHALNEVVVTRGIDVRPIRLEARVDGFAVAHFVADGLIVATPTGSTAYALAAGGPILPPDLHNLLIVPVAPHLSVDRAVVLSEGTSVRVMASTTHQAVMSVDGQTPIPLKEGDYVQAYASENMVSFIRFQDPGYFYRNLMTYMERNPSVGKGFNERRKPD
jgi:NAD+ kinase